MLKLGKNPNIPIAEHKFHIAAQRQGYVCICIIITHRAMDTVVMLQQSE